MANVADRTIEQLALFLNGRDTQESGTAVWEKLPIDARMSYLKDAEAILGAVRLLNASSGTGSGLKLDSDTSSELGESVPADEREALASLIQASRYSGRVFKATSPADFRVADRILAAGFRRQGPMTDAAYAAFCESLGWSTAHADRMGMRAALEAARDAS